jgi:hypothetical protein
MGSQTCGRHTKAQHETNIIDIKSFDVGNSTWAMQSAPTSLSSALAFVQSGHLLSGRSGFRNPHMS